MLIKIGNQPVSFSTIFGQFTIWKEGDFGSDQDNFEGEGLTENNQAASWLQGATDPSCASFFASFLVRVTTH